ncbi:SDR family oxidoreductase [Candidatus Gottesmanbacteria bacterium]|nr:SDR family oxidoreductase [Candidatus Gottesmanbacteria bacterium]
MKYNDHVVLITGSSSGIGKEAAIKFAIEGANVVINCRTDVGEGEKVAKQIKQMGRNALCIKADVSDPNQVKRLFQESEEYFGTIDILINNAGLATPKPFFDITRRDLIKEFEENFFSMVYCSQEAAKLMKKRKSGSIINVSSICGLTGCTSILTFTSARSAVTGFTKALAKILAPNITVNAVAPGFTKTRFWDKQSQKEEKNLLATTLSRRWIMPGEIADVMLYLAGAKNVTGQILVVDGGYMTTI